MFRREFLQTCSVIYFGKLFPINYCRQFSIKFNNKMVFKNIPCKVFGNIETEYEFQFVNKSLYKTAYLAIEKKEIVVNILFNNRFLVGNLKAVSLYNDDNLNDIFYKILIKGEKNEE